jgi:hypothetical protein
VPTQNKRRIIKLSDHAKGRIISRGVEESDIVRIINMPLETIYDEYEEDYKTYGTAIDPYTKESFYLIIVHTALNTHVKIITIMWVNSEGGLRAHGFSNL